MTKEARIDNGEKTVNKRCWENWTAIKVKRMKLEHSLTPYTNVYKNKLKMD